jgi:26S proteasome regulatory subunit N9
MIGYSSFAPAEAVGFFASVLRSRDRLGVEASLCLDIDVMHMKLLVGERQEVKHYIEDHRDEVQKGSYEEATVCSKFFKLTMEYHKIVGTAQEFYRAALTYLSYTPLEELSVEERFSLATDMAIAAVVGDAVYNLGEVIATPILGYLKGTENEWLLNLVLALNDGDIDKFNSIVDPASTPYFTQAAFARDHELVKQKLVLIALMNLVFDTPPQERTISYAAIAERVRMPVDQVDWILMKALSLGLIKGRIDEVAQSIDVSWVQARVMSIAQARVMEDNVNAWVAK